MRIIPWYCFLFRFLDSSGIFRKPFPFRNPGNVLSELQYTTLFLLFKYKIVNTYINFVNAYIFCCFSWKMPGIFLLKCLYICVSNDHLHFLYEIWKMLIKNNEHTLIHIKIMCVRQINYLMLHENIPGIYYYKSCPIWY